MRSVKTATLLLAVLVLSFAGMAQAADDDPVTVAGILAAAKCPLTEEQVKTYNSLELGGDMANFRTTLNSLFTDAQLEALRAKLGTTPARGTGAGGAVPGGAGAAGTMADAPRNLTQLVILEKAGVPLTEKQVSDMQNMQMGQGGMQQMNELYTDAQREAMSQYMGGGRGMGGGGMGGGGMGGPPPGGP